MSGKFTVFTAPAIAKIHAMRLSGAKVAEIAAVIGTTTSSLSSRMNQLGITKRKVLRRRPAVDPVHRSIEFGPAIRVGTVVKDDGVYHALDAGWHHLGWFAEHHLAKNAVRDHHDQHAASA